MAFKLMMQMVFKLIESIDAPEFYNILMNETKELTIKDVSDIKTNDMDGSKYIFIDYLMDNYSDSIGVSYNLDIKPDTNGDAVISITENSKLYPIVSYISGLTNGTIGCSIEDLKESIGTKFLASAKKERAGNKTYYKIIPKKEVEY